MKHTVTLTLAELTIAAHVGAQRKICDMKEGCVSKNKMKNTVEWDNEMVGVFTEMAAAKYLNMFWSGAVGNTKAKDVGPYQVRGTREHHHRLVTHDWDDDNDIFILVTGDGRTPFQIHGWMFGRDAKNREMTDPTGTGRWAYFAPQAEVQPMSTLPKEGEF